jgi:hypothetical protein
VRLAASRLASCASVRGVILPITLIINSYALRLQGGAAIE